MYSSMGGRPQDWGVGGSFLWKDGTEKDEIDVEFDFHARWRAKGVDAAMTLRTFQGEVRSRLIISVLPSVAGHWLIGRLNRQPNRRLEGFLGLVPALRLDLRVEEDPVDPGRAVAR